MGVFAAAGDAGDGFCHEADFEAVGTKDVFDDVANVGFVVGSLEDGAVFPVDFELLHDVSVFAGRVEFGADAADFFVAHFDFEAVLVEEDEGFFERGADGAASSLPILFFEFLGGGELFAVGFVVGGFDPKFELGGSGHGDFVDV